MVLMRKVSTLIRLMDLSVAEMMNGNLLPSGVGMVASLNGLALLAEMKDSGFSIICTVFQSLMTKVSEALVATILLVAYSSMSLSISCLINIVNKLLESQASL